MTDNTLVDLLKSRGCDAVCYFHTDHFEPWSITIDDASARAVDRMAAMARSSAFGRRLSLFYNVFVPYRLASEGPVEAGDVRTPQDEVVFIARSAKQEELAREAIRPLVTADGHEMHLHIHHEYWTRNASHFDQPVSRWVNAHSTAEADRRRLDLNIKLSREAISREIGTPFERWAFIHGNWALNASDPLICHVTDEMAIIMRHGGFADFSFPAGRSYCDPKLETPFTCLPLNLPRAYDDPRADPRPIGNDTNVMRPGRFFIWNSPIKSVHSSLDYYTAANRAIFRNPDRVVATWLSKSVCLGRRLFIKTHAHSMKSDYRLSEPDSVIPHCYPDIVAAFESLARACDRAKVELQLLTVNEVVAVLRGLDGELTGADGTGVPPAESFPGPSASSEVLGKPVHFSTLATSPDEPAETMPQSGNDWHLDAVAADLTGLHREWMLMQSLESRLPPDELYKTKLDGGGPLEPYEIAIAHMIADRYPREATRVLEIGCGWGGFAILLARLGYEVFGFEGNVRRHTACKWHFDRQIQRFPALGSRLFLAPVGLFPQLFPEDALAQDKINLCIATNITSSYSAAHQEEIIHAAAKGDELILDLARFGQVRDQQVERDALFDMVRAGDFKPVEQLYFSEPYEYWRLRSRAVQGAARVRSAHSIEPPRAVQRPTTGESLSPVPTLHSPAIGRYYRLFSVSGDRHLDQCPVCHSSDIVQLWRIPATTLAEPIQVFGGYFNQIPTLQIPGTLFCFDFCHDCESIFLNPVPSGQKEGYRQTDHYIRKMQTKKEWRGYEDVYDTFASWIPAEAKVMIDAACGIGQYLHVARGRGTHSWRRLIGLELAEKYVEQMRREGFEAHVFDLDSEDLLSLISADSVDFITFCEGFEHVERPLDALGKLLAVLRPGGRLFFTAQRYGGDVQAAVRPGEPIYIGEKLVNELPRRLGCRIARKTTSPMRYHLVLEK